MIVGDVVLVIEEDVPRNQWLLGRVDEVYSDEVGLMRKVKVMVATLSLDKNGKRHEVMYLKKRPIHKLVLLLLVAEDWGIPAEKK